jgi:hypothetical protein
MARDGSVYVFRTRADSGLANWHQLTVKSPYSSSQAPTVFCAGEGRNTKSEGDEGYREQY